MQNLLFGTRFTGGDASACTLAPSWCQQELRPAVKMTNGQEAPPEPPPPLPHIMCPITTNTSTFFSSPFLSSLRFMWKREREKKPQSYKAVTLWNSSPSQRFSYLQSQRKGLKSTQGALEKQRDTKKEERRERRAYGRRERGRADSAGFFLPVLGNLSLRLATCNQGRKRVDARTFPRL